MGRRCREVGDGVETVREIWSPKLVSTGVPHEDKTRW